jgi:ubiquinone/menaquinone biosynthesis C-methylase UbiE
MSKFTDYQYLTRDQYKDATNLDARIQIHKRFSTNPYGWFQWVFDTLGRLPEKANILEVGCGPAVLWKECAGRIPDEWTITLSDLSIGMLDAARQNLASLKRDFEYKQMDAQSIPYEDQTFDAVIANHMLYHVPDRKKALLEIRRVLKDKGSLIATTIGESHMAEMNVWIKRASNNGQKGMFSLVFTLENGLSQLQEFFSKVEISRYPDGLNVTQVEPIMRYIRSATKAADLSEDELGKVEKELTTVLEREGEIFISKDSGLFEAVK